MSETGSSDGAANPMKAWIKHQMKMNVTNAFIRRKINLPCPWFREFPMDKRPPLRSTQTPRNDFTVLPINNPYRPGLYTKPFSKFQSYAFAGKARIPTEPNSDQPIDLKTRPDTIPAIPQPRPIKPAEIETEEPRFFASVFPSSPIRSLSPETTE